MTRRHSGPQDFELVGMETDPTPGDPDLIQDVITRYRDVGDAAQRALNILERGGSISRGRGSSIEALQTVIGDDLPDKLRKTVTSYHDAAQAYADYAPQLREAQETFDRAVDQAAEAAPRANMAPPALGPDPSEEQRAEASNAEDLISAGKDALNAAKSLAQQAREMRERAQGECADVLDRAASQAIPERNIFQKIRDFFEDFPFVKILLSILIAVVAVFFPVAGALLGGALFALEQISAIASGDFSLGDLVVGLIGLVPGVGLVKAGGTVVKSAAGAVGGLAPKASKSVGESITGVASSIAKSKPTGGLLNGQAGRVATGAGGQFAEGAAQEAAAQAIDGEQPNFSAIAGAGALGLVGGGLAGRGRPRRTIPVKGTTGSGTLTRSGVGSTAPSLAPAAGSAPAPPLLTALGSPLNGPGTGVDLQSHEKLGGHTIGRHVMKSDSFLIGRLTQTNKIKLASTFRDIATAEKATLDNIAHNQSTINNFLASKKQRTEITLPQFDPAGGVVFKMDNGLPASGPPSKVKTILAKDPSAPGGFRIVTSFPEP